MPEKNLHPLLLPLLLMVFLSGCYEPKDGCLDVNATNFDLDADRPCPDNCCEYPELRLSLQHKWVYPAAAYTLNLGDTLYPDAGGHLFRLDKIAFLLSGFRLTFSDGSILQVSDSLEIDKFAADLSREPAVIKDDILLVKPPGSAGLVVGNFRNSGVIQSISFTIGLEDPANSADPSSAPNSHPLQDTAQFIEPGLGYYANKISLFRTAESTDTIPLALNMPVTGSRTGVSLPVTDHFILQPGFNLRITLQVDYSRWFAQIQDIRNDPPEILIRKIVDSLAQSFEIKSIVSER